MVDWNHDGFKDLLLGESNGRVRYYRRVDNPTGSGLTLHFEGYLRVGTVYLDVGFSSAPWATDWNGDGLIDLLVGNNDGYVRLYLNTGTNYNPTFSSTQSVRLANGDTLMVEGRCDPCVVDLNGDGRNDLVCGNGVGKIQYFQNNGTPNNPQLAPGVFLTIGAQPLQVTITASPAPIDWDYDGDWDLVVGCSEDRLRRFMKVLTTPVAPTLNMENLGPETIPGNGGYLQYSYTLVNPSPVQVRYDLWTELQHPYFGGYSSTLVLLSMLTLNPFDSLTQIANTYVPGTLPPGPYKLYGYAGKYSTLEVYDEDYVSFMRTGRGQEACGCPAKEHDFLPVDFTRPPEAALSSLQVMASPNPFNACTTLSFTLPEAALVDLGVYNCAGQQVARIAQGQLGAGAQNFSWSPEGLTSGLYFIKLEAGRQRSVKKLVYTR